MVEDNINFDYILRYIRRTLKPKTGILRELEIYAENNDVPISQPETIRLIELLVKISGAERILEIGTAIGYSALCMVNAGALSVDTVEIDEATAKIAVENIEKAGFSDRINVHIGDAKDVIKTLDTKYDMIFIDAAKGQYNVFFDESMRLLKKGGILVSDNILYKGMTATDELVLHRKITIVKRLRAYVDMLCNHPQLETDIIPIGDGVALSYRTDGE